MKFLVFTIFFFLLIHSEKANSEDTIIEKLYREYNLNHSFDQIKRSLTNNKNNSKYNNIHAYSQLARIKSHIKQADSAIYYITQALSSINNNSKVEDITACYNLASRIYFKSNKKQKALKFAIKASELAASKSIDSELITSYYLIGQISMSLEEYKISYDYYKKLVNHSKKNEDFFNLAIDLFQLAEIENELQYFDNAIENYTKTISLAKKTKNNSLIISAYHSLSETYLLKGDSINWKKNFIKTTELLKRNNRLEKYLENLCSLSEYNFKKGNYNKALLYCDTILRKLNLTKNIELHKKLFSLLYKTHKSKGDFKKALDYHERLILENETKTDKKKAENIVNQTPKTEKNLNNINWKTIYLICSIAIIIILILLIVKYFDIVKESIKIWFSRKLKTMKSKKIRNFFNMIFGSSLTEKDKFYIIYTKLVKFMEEDKIYLNPQLNQEDLLRKLFTNKKYMYLAIKKYSNDNFKGFINKYRIEEAKKQIKEKVNLNDKYVLSDIYSKCGFSTNESFYRTFKQITSYTPGQYATKVEVDLLQK